MNIFQKIQNHFSKKSEKSTSKLTKEDFLSEVSKIEQTSEDEFRAEYNSPELLWDNFLSKYFK